MNKEREQIADDLDLAIERMKQLRYLWESPEEDFQKTCKTARECINGIRTTLSKTERALQQDLWNNAG